MSVAHGYSLALLSSFRHVVLKYLRLFTSKRSLARLLSTLLCSIIIAIRPFSRLGGEYPFLVLALKELVFSVQENLAQQLELTVLNIMGALLGVGLSTLAKFGASKTAPDSTSGRAICAVTLIMISFFAGLIKSRLPRLQLSTRISCFVSVWILTLNIGIPSRVLPDSGAFVWITLTASIICLCSLLIIMLPFQWVSTNFESDIASSFSSLHHCLSIALNANFSSRMPSGAEREMHSKMQAQLLATSIKLNETYSQAAFELRTGQLSLRSIRPFITTIEHLRRELAWGMPLKQPPELRRRGSKSPLRIDQDHGEAFNAIIGPPAQNLGHSVLNAMRCIESTVLLAYTPRNPSSPRLGLSSYKESDSSWILNQLDATRAAQKQLGLAADEAKAKLGLLYEGVQMGEAADGTPIEVPKEIYDDSLAMVALLQMADEMLIALHVAESLIATCLQSPSRLWYPRISLAWFGVPPGPFISDDPSANLSVNLALDKHTTTTRDSHVLSEHERRQGLAEYAKQLAKKKRREEAIHGLDNGQTLTHWTISSIWRWVTSSLSSWLWMNSRALDIRVKLWTLHKSLKNSHHLEHALKNAVGVAILTFPAFLPNTSSGYSWYQSWHGQWMTISYLWVLETNTGATWRTGYLRILGTCIGALYAFVSWAICRVNPYGIVVLVTAADVPISWLIIKTNLTPLAVPCSVAISSIVFVNYFQPDLTRSIIGLTLLRALMITAGMVAALLMNSLIFPRHCRVLFLSHASRTFGLLSSLYLTLSHEMFHSTNVFVADDRRKTLKLELQTRNELYRLSALITTMRDEFGLLPKPIRHYRKAVANMQKFLDLLTGLRKIRENIPRQETVIDVFTERRAFMSCICILLFACQHVFHTREPLPQFLPSARRALCNLERHVHDCLRKSPHHDEVSFGYVFAEQETMRNMVDTLEKLLELSGELFGTSAWLTQDASWSTATMVDEGNDGWYSTLKWEDV